MTFDICGIDVPELRCDETLQDILERGRAVDVSTGIPALDDFWNRSLPGAAPESVAVCETD